MDCFRSGLDGADAVGPVLEGLAGCADVPPPKKSKPNNESPALVCFGGAGSAFGGTCLPTGGPVLARGGAGDMSPKRSMAGCAWGCARGGGGWLDWDASRCDAERSICTFSCTFFKGYILVSTCLTHYDVSYHPPHRRLQRPR